MYMYVCIHLVIRSSDAGDMASNKIRNVETKLLNETTETTKTERPEQNEANEWKRPNRCNLRCIYLYVFASFFIFIVSLIKVFRLSDAGCLIILRKMISIPQRSKLCGFSGQYM